MQIRLALLAVFLVACGTQGGEHETAGSAKAESTSSGEHSKDRTRILVLAAASLTGPLGEAAHNFETERGQENSAGSIQVDMSFAASNILRLQIQRGAPADLFIAAAPSEIDRLIASRHVMVENSFDLWTTDLVLIAGKGGEDRTDLETTIANAQRVAIGDIGVPIGDYARQALGQLGLEFMVKGKLIPLPDERAVIQAVATGSVDVGIAYRASSTAPEVATRVQIVASFPDDSHAPVRYVAAIPEAAPHADAARSFIEYLTRGAGGVRMQAAGFTSTLEPPIDSPPESREVP